MNYYHADVLTNELAGVLRFYTTVDTVITPHTVFSVAKVDNFLPGDIIEITVGTAVRRATIISIAGNQLTVTPSVMGLAHGQIVRFTLPHKIYGYKDIESSSAATMERPFVAVTLPSQPGIARIPVGSAPEIGLRDATRVAIYVETPFTVLDSAVGETVGGFDRYHHPAIRHLRKFIWGNKALDIPGALHDPWRSGTLGMSADSPPEKAWRSADSERHIFFVTLWDFVTMPGG